MCFAINILSFSILPLPKTFTAMFSWIKSLQEFCSYASIPGLHYIGQRNAHIIQRLFWIVAFISALALFVAGCYAAISDFNTKTTNIVSEDRQASLDQIFFPSLVICNVNKFRSSFVYYIIDNRKFLT